MDAFIIFGAKYLIVVPVVATVYLLSSLRGHDRLRLLAMLAVGGLLAVGTAHLVSPLIDSPRPFLADGVTALVSARHDNGFPSDHTLLSAFLAFTCLVFARKLGLALLAVALCVGVSRVLANVHHGIDIAGGFAIAAIAVATSYWLSNLVLPGKIKR